MAKKAKEMRAFKIRPESEKEQIALDIFHCLKAGADPLKVCLRPEASKAADYAENYLNLAARRELIRASVGNSSYKFNKDHGKILGVGFRSDECFLTVIDLAGNILEEEKITIELLVKGRAKNKDINGIVSVIDNMTKLKGRSFLCVGVAVPEEILESNPKSVDLFARGIADIFGCSIFTTTSATAAGYADKDLTPACSGKNILYMYADVGIGVVFKKELIFEADEYSGGKAGAYLRPWNQFSIVNAAKDFVLRGIGTDVVHMVGGDVDKITLDVVFAAAGKNDELAEELIKRSGLALGVRVAYLVNMFNADIVVFGGGVETDGSLFVNEVRESMGKFLSPEVFNALKTVPGVLGKKSSSAGAALLCRREMFMEV